MGKIKIRRKVSMGYDGFWNEIKKEIFINEL